MLKPEQITNAMFTPVSKGTYSAEEVDAFLKSVAASYEESLDNNRELIKKISILADKIESYRSEEDAIKLALLDAHKMAETVNKNAAEKAEALVSDAENKSKLILDGANRQASQTIEEAREKAKEIVDNARTAVSSLTERAQIETDTTIAEAKKKASEIIANAEEKGREIIGTSKQSYEFYSAELEKVQAKTAEFKATVEAVCKDQLNLLGGIPSVFEAAAPAPAIFEPVAPAAPISIPVEEAAEETVEEAAEEAVPFAPTVFVEETVEPAADAVDSAFEEAAEEIDIAVEEEVAEEEDAEEEEHDASAIALMAEINGLADEVLTSVDDKSVVSYDDESEEIVAEIEIEDVIVEEFAEEETEAVGDDDDDLLSLIDDMDFVDIPDSIPASLDDLVPSEPVFDMEDEAEEKEEDDDEEFEGFQINLDAITDENDDDEDITSLFNSLFDD